ncbi:hypothetical protein HC251_00570 [Iamia sp. SCSIO 61187]|uniref:hypothetical protein n=1 Tax=Iamia sp. SCSIO 61187 TaxID=2722752 RepID=UPI001C63353D|nr:hypothetical protein [Iamia sp. SCSIO 61187]QYG91074.1 hypothetical protein HC251_00570 [Iamia sp. SCSIO 61187]
MARPKVRAALAGATTVAPDRDTHPPLSLLGHAISTRICWEFGPGEGFELAGAHLSPAAFWVGDEAVRDAFFAAAATPVREVAPDVAAAVAWVAGVADQEYRSGQVDEAATDRMRTARSIADLAEPAWRDDVVAVTRHCRSIVEGHVARGGTAPVAFVGKPVRADGDYVTSDGLLVAVKATTSPSLRARDLRQLVAYTLLDRDDVHGIASVALLFARQAVLVEWPLDGLLAGMAGRPVALEELRKELQSSLTG